MVKTGVVRRVPKGAERIFTNAGKVLKRLTASQRWPAASSPAFGRAQEARDETKVLM